MKSSIYIGEWKGFPLKERVAKPEPGSPRYDELTVAIRQWRSASLQSDQCMGICENAARELEIERDHGVVVHITPRC